ncbi:hypothetical protein M409DRAFT_27584 [Zasmidium cellare ATCC 36951]|uniref:Uncharacterized protein n=1 Tax=Zasmidium cellare ATCC 36951 TaxID=1080233 RepID=A0A6A6C4V7_ZASCE|nr:uncharacterized protein M409DRAFT_27584 [Zasmidium cellare ATCC 36951]KAF2162207.1 hypothetical protein M409DRAFT_27584 [Zasmidium cellare ATCC 36951]
MSQPQEQPPPSQREKYAKAVHNAALFAVIACPVLALIPPRKLDVYTLGLVGVTGYSANYLVAESTGRTVWQHVSRQAINTPTRLEKEQGSVVGELQKEGRGSRETWKMQRRKEIEQDVEEGKGFGDMIVDQIWHVWNQGKSADEEEEEE